MSKEDRFEKHTFKVKESSGKIYYALNDDGGAPLAIELSLHSANDSVFLNIEEVRELAAILLEQAECIKRQKLKDLIDPPITGD